MQCLDGSGLEKGLNDSWNMRTGVILLEHHTSAMDLCEGHTIVDEHLIPITQAGESSVKNDQLSPVVYADTCPDRLWGPADY